MRNNTRIAVVLLFTVLILFFAGAGPIRQHLFFSVRQAVAEDEEKQPEKAGEPADGNRQPCPECPECPDPAKVILRGLEEKKQQIEAARKKLDLEKTELERYEAQIDEKIDSLTALKAQIEKDFALLDEKKDQRDAEKQAEYEQKIARLVKMYAEMKPKSAAEIVNKMNLEVAQEIFSRMREASASAILAYVDSEKAAKISERMAFKKN